MPPTRSNHQSYLPYALVVASWILYSGLGLFAPPMAMAKAAYHLPAGGLNAIRITILVPVLIFWFIAIYGAQTFARYAELVSGSPEEHPLRLLSTALYITLVYFIISAVFGQLLHFYTSSVGYPQLVIMHDHLPAIITLVAFGYFYVGSSRLLLTAKIKHIASTTWIVTAITVLLALAFGLRFLTMPTPSSASLVSSLAYVPRPILLVTLYLPYFLSWWLGTLSVINIYRYARRVQGVLYRNALKDLARGLILVIAFSAFSGVLILLAATISSLSIGPILLILYFALLLYGAGYALVAKGAANLSRIEGISVGKSKRPKRA